MKKYIICLTLAFVCLTITVQAQNSCQKQSIHQLATNLANAFEAKNLGNIDATRPFLKQIVVRTENSLSADGETGQYEYKKLKSFTQFEKWLKSGAVEGFPNRASYPVKSCQKGICTYKMQGLLHNTLFLQKISYSYKKDGCPYIKSVFLIDGN